MSLIYKHHVESSAAPSQSADSYGAFRESCLAVLHGDALPIVPDANVLRGDIARACKNQHRTVLTNGANQGSFRLYCAKHVIDEVHRYLPEWANSTGCPTDTYRTCWEEQYLPLLRVVRTEALHTVLSPIEKRRIGDLTDRDDVPSATLALALQAVFVSEDRKPHFTVYDFKTSAEERRNWVHPLMSAANSAQLSLYLNGTMLIPIAGAAGLLELGKTLNRISPVAALGFLGVGVAATAWLAQYGSAIRNGLASVGRFYSHELLTPRDQCVKQFQRLIPSIPSWYDLRETNSADEVLSRAVMHTMARNRQGLMTPSDISDALPVIPISNAPSRVGRILRNNAFVSPYKSCWQLGTVSVSA